MKIIVLTSFLVQTFAASPLIQTRILNGENAQEGQIPYIVSYQAVFPKNRFAHLCGGSIIAKLWVITAAHCITETPPKFRLLGKFQVVAGSSNLLSLSPERQEISVVQQIVHPSYSGGPNPYDLALLRLETPLTFGLVVQPVRLPPAGSAREGTARVSGWGLVTKNKAPTKLQTAQVEVISFNECRRYMQSFTREDVVFEDLQVCVRPGKQAVCSGDSGGPLVQNGALIGVLSWGPLRCSSSKVPSVFTKISSFIKFVERYTKEEPQREKVAVKNDEPRAWVVVFFNGFI